MLKNYKYTFFISSCLIKCDLTAFLQAYLTYLNKHGDEEVLPGLPLSNEKLFFISYAQVRLLFLLLFLSSTKRTFNL